MCPRLQTILAHAAMIFAGLACSSPSAWGNTVLNLGTGPKVSNNVTPIGMNLEQPNSWSANYLFVNAALKGRKWISHGCTDKVWDNQVPVVTDANGWVKSTPSGTCPGILLLDEAIGTTVHYVPLGTYVLIWEGEGEIQVNLLPRPAVKCKSGGCTRVNFRTLRSSGPGQHRATFQIINPNRTAVDVRLVKFNRRNYIRNIRVIMPGGNISKDGIIDDTTYCRTARGPFGPEPVAAVEKLKRGQTCVDFAETYWDPVYDSLKSIHRFRNGKGRPSRGGKVLFHPLTLQNLSASRVLRASEWLHTTASPITQWEQRTSYLHQNQVESPHGVALEYLVSLANVTGADLWYSVPHMANDDYVTQLAQFLRDNLHPSLKVYVEYSNEIWNPSPLFTQGAWVEQQCANDFPDDTPYTRRLKCQAKLAMSVADRFDEEFGAESNKRVVNVLSGQAASTFVGETLLADENISSHFDAYGIAPYFGYALQDGLPPPESATLDDVFARVEAVAIPTSIDWIKQNLPLVQQKGLRLIAYETGQHLEDSLQNRYTNLFIAANRDPRMGLAIKSLFDQSKAAGIDELIFFTDVSFYDVAGSWGALETPTRLDTPKWQALQEFAAANPCWWESCTR